MGVSTVFYLNFNLDGFSESEINYSKCVLAIITELRVISVLSINPSKEGWEPDQLRNHAGFSWSCQNCLGLSLDFLGPIGFVAANLAANWPQAALVKRDVNPAKTDL